MTIKDLLLHLTISIFALGCVTAPKPLLPGYSPVLIETKAQIKDFKKDESHSAKIEIVLLPNQAVRMEVSALFGYPIATIVMTPLKIQYALHTTKQFVEGSFSARTLYPVFKQNIDPRILWNSIHDRTPAGSDLKCTVNASEKPLNCIGMQGVTIQYTYENPVKRRIEIKNHQFQMIWVFKDQSPFVVTQNETFVLKKPEEYQQIQIK
ncbi:MAG: hypothetical protein A2622_07000 [Bdellovibrionales bacterium RIFCSPHIGHO2_01_FULL_40_29]|nr:MAG: hypothetical protein A2622_07000 [Bdellovibrionales bacterium RIFCSPHIGHO2_01_FULL_40_29]OFZ33225.1 MAG: hypothetical protein A3D17_12020 [Bdellovibrionales bacterium RIFCSPHIGHO2_02_FULL_40_15]